MSVDYPGLILGMVKNQIPFPLISEPLDQVNTAGVLTKLALWNCYNLMSIKGGDEFETAYRTKHGQFE